MRGGAGVRSARAASVEERQRDTQAERDGDRGRGKRSAISQRPHKIYKAEKKKKRRAENFLYNEHFFPLLSPVPFLSFLFLGPDSRADPVRDDCALKRCRASDAFGLGST